MFILSFDVGIRNLAYVLIETEPDNLSTHRIIKWEVVELCPKDCKAALTSNIVIGQNIISHLDKEFHNLSFDFIIIENQIGQNAIKMKTVQNMLNMYFITKGYGENEIINYNAVHKLKHFIGSTKTTYAQRKKLSKQITEQICIVHYDKDTIAYYKKYKKKDDLADCLLQGLDFMKKKNLLDQSFFDNVVIET